MPFPRLASALRALVLLPAFACAAALAQPVPPSTGILSLATSATIEVDRDLMSLTFSTSREGPDAAAIQSQLKQALDAALSEARKVAKPGQVDLRTGQFALSPRYSSKGVVSGWQGTAELVVEGRDMQAIAQLSGRITTLTIARVNYQLSREAREKVESDVAAQAIARFRAQATGHAKLFGYNGYEIRDVNVNTAQPSPYAPRQMMRADMAMAAAAPESLPVEAGKGSVTATVNGSVQMK